MSAERLRLRVTLLVVATLTGVAMACTDRSVAASSSSVAPTVYAWMQCQDCLSGERSKVVALGDTAVSMLGTLLLSGPPPEHTTAVRRSLDELAARLPAARAPSQVTIDRQVERFTSMYRARAASALAGIGSSSARQALCNARNANLPAVDSVAVDSAITSIGGTCP